MKMPTEFKYEKSEEFDVDLEGFTNSSCILDVSLEMLTELADAYAVHCSEHGIVAEHGFKRYVFSQRYLIGQLITNTFDQFILKRSYLGETPQELIVSVTASDSSYRVSVEDNATGIYPEVEPYLFTMLSETPLNGSYKLIEEYSSLGMRGRGGTGLSQLKRFADDKDGKVGYVNKGKDQGAIFWYEAPICHLQESLANDF